MAHSSPQLPPAGTHRCPLAQRQKVRLKQEAQALGAETDKSNVALVSWLTFNHPCTHLRPSACSLGIYLLHCCVSSQGAIQC